VSLTLCVLLWAVPGRQAELAAYEDEVLVRLAAHEGRLLSRLRVVSAGEDEAEGEAAPDEIQTLEFADEDALQGYLADPDRAPLSPRRDRAIARTQVLTVRAVNLA
jgi:uncharacterized protein (DUF1330 family)